MKKQVGRDSDLRVEEKLNLNIDFTGSCRAGGLEQNIMIGEVQPQVHFGMMICRANLRLMIFITSYRPRKLKKFTIIFSEDDRCILT